MSEKKIKCPFCDGVAHVKKNARLDPFISCPRCGPINARGAKYRDFIEKHQYEQAPPVAPPDIPVKVDEIKPLYKHTVSSTKDEEDWLQW